MVWLVFADNTRRQTFVARWLGRGWSQILDGPALFHRSPDFDANRVPADRLALEKRPPPAAADLGVALASDAVATARELHRIAVPAPAAADGGYVLFLDMLEVGAWSGLRQVLEPAAKAPENPVFPVAREEDAFDRARTTGHGTVLRDGERFRMWYTGISTDREMPWWQNIWIGYAESEDGRRWRRVSTGNVAPSGKRGDNVLLFPIPSRWHPPDVARPRGGPIVAPGIPNMAAVLKDERDPNPARRYKLVWVAHALRTRLMAEHGHFELDAPYLPAWLFSSPDGLDWRAEAAIVDFRAGRPWTFAFCSVYEDERAADPATRYRAAGFFTPGARRRTGGVASSPDLVHWTGHPRNPAFEPLARGIPVMPAGPPQQIHDTVVFPYRGLHLALYQYQYDTRHLHDIELAVSRDGERFQLVRPGDKVIPKGPPGAWDANYILPSAPVVVGDEIYLYYCGGGPPPDFPAGQHCDEGDAIGQGGLAVLRRDGFVHVTPTSAAGGVLETIPLAASGAPWRLVVNARCSTAAAIAVEVLDAATGRPVPGLERETCHPLRDDVVRQGVSWSGRSVVALPAGVGRVRLRFYLDGGPGEPRLYGFGFESADQEVCHDRDTG